MDSTLLYGTRRLWIFVLAMLIIFDCYFHIYVYYNVLQSPKRRIKYHVSEILNPNVTDYYKYPLVNGSEASMDYEIGYNSSYFWFISMKHLFKDLSADATLKYPRNMSMCAANISRNPYVVNYSEPDLALIEELNSEVAIGGYYAPAHCKSANRVAIIIPCRDRRVNLAICLRYIHLLLKKQLLEYRIFVIEQNGTEKFNKGILHNIAFLEIQRFGSWDCLIIHDVDLVPADDSIPYSCPKRPTQLASAMKSLPYRRSFGGVTAVTPKDYSKVNGYSNFYWNWGAEDDDFYARLASNNLTVTRYNGSVGRYTTLPHNRTALGNERHLLLMLSKLRWQKEGLATTKYKLLKVTEEKLYTHIIADVNPTRMKLDMKSMMRRLLRLHGETIIYGRRAIILSKSDEIV